MGSRSLERATKFSEEFGGTPYGSYEEVLASPDVDAVYISTPHHLHMEWTMKAAEAGKAILCEKPFTLNALEAQKALDVVKANNVFFMEAFMYRCAPQTRKLVELLKENAIGKPLCINSEFGFHAGKDWDNFRADGAVGGGGLMDVGTYSVSLSRLVAGEEPNQFGYSAFLGPKGYDETGSGSMGFPSGFNAHFGTGVHVQLVNDARIYGESGWIHIEDPWKTPVGRKMTLHRRGKDAEVFDLGVTNDELYASEADATADFLEAKECPYMSHADTIGQMKALDGLRAAVGLTFAAEMKA